MPARGRSDESSCAVLPKCVTATIASACPDVASVTAASHIARPCTVRSASKPCASATRNEAGAATVSARHHHGVGGGENTIEAFEGLRALDLRDERRVAGQAACRLTVTRRLDEAERHQVDAKRQAERQVRLVLRGDGGGGQRDAGRVDALVLRQTAAVDDDRDQL